jgi:DNA-3-methyladenine glycosylase II
MWFDDDDASSGNGDARGRWAKAVRYLSQDRVMGKLIQRIGPCTLRPRGEPFVTLVQSILSQQVSVKAADSMYRKLSSKFPRKRPTPERLLQFLTNATEDEVRGCGLSRQKRGYMLDLARCFSDGTVPAKRLARMTDDEVIACVTQVKGIGQWTAEMLLIFSLGRPDIWPIDDLGIRESLFRLWPEKFTERPAPKMIADFADQWRPWRSVASWYLWAEKDK